MTFKLGYMAAFARVRACMLMGSFKKVCVKVFWVLFLKSICRKWLWVHNNPFSTLTLQRALICLRSGTWALTWHQTLMERAEGFFQVVRNTESQAVPSPIHVSADYSVHQQENHMNFQILDVWRLEWWEQRQYLLNTPSYSSLWSVAKITLLLREDQQ